MNYPKKSFTRAACAHASFLEAGLSGRREALFLRPLAEETAAAASSMDPMDVDVPQPVSPVRLTTPSNAWESAAIAHSTLLDRQLSEERRFPAAAVAAAVGRLSARSPCDAMITRGSRPRIREAPQTLLARNSWTYSSSWSRQVRAQRSWSSA
jgi:hypothetical protein